MEWYWWFILVVIIVISVYSTIGFAIAFANIRRDRRKGYSFSKRMVVYEIRYGMCWGGFFIGTTIELFYFLVVFFGFR